VRDVLQQETKYEDAYNDVMTSLFKMTMSGAKGLAMGVQVCVLPGMEEVALMVGRDVERLRKKGVFGK
jgi:hypothetical protein